MSQFLGTHQNRLDAKGRVSVPARFRGALRVLADEAVPYLVLRPSLQFDCIEGWPGALFRRLSNAIDRVDPLDPQQSDTATLLFADAWPVEADREGRIIIPEPLVEHARLSEGVVFMGLGDTFQIWEPVAADRRRAEARERARARAMGAALPGTFPTGAP